MPMNLSLPSTGMLLAVYLLRTISSCGGIKLSWGQVTTIKPYFQGHQPARQLKASWSAEPQNMREVLVAAGQLIYPMACPFIYIGPWENRKKCIYDLVMYSRYANNTILFQIFHRAFDYRFRRLKFTFSPNCFPLLC